MTNNKQKICTLTCPLHAQNNTQHSIHPIQTTLYLESRLSKGLHFDKPLFSYKWFHNFSATLTTRNPGGVGFHLDGQPCRLCMEMKTWVNALKQVCICT